MRSAKVNGRSAIDFSSNCSVVGAYIKQNRLARIELLTAVFRLLGVFCFAHYNGCMTNEAKSVTQGEGASASISDTALEGLGRLFAAAADMLEGQAILRRRGPTRLRRLESVLATLMCIVITMATRHRAIAISRGMVVERSKWVRQLCHPPQGWSAP